MTADDTQDGGERMCPDHSRGIRHPGPHVWVRRTLRKPVRYTCPGSTLGTYADRAEWRAAEDKRRGLLDA